MSTKTDGKNGQHNVYNFYEGGKHEHSWYNSKTGQMGYHGENASAEDKKWMGQTANESTHGEWTKGVKN